MSAPTFVQCPQCRQSLPPGAQRCHFCGTALSGTPASGPAAPARGPHSVHGVVIIDPQKIKQRNKLSWQEWGYIVCSVLVLIAGLANFIVGVMFSQTGFGQAIGIGGGVTALGAVGLLLQVDWVQFLMKWMCVLSCMSSFGNAMIWFMLATRMPIAAVGGLLYLLSAVVNGALVYFIVQLSDA